MRTAFINELINLARENERIFLLVADLGFSVVEPFAEEFPTRYLNVGIAEQNMAGIAAGLAMEDYCVFIYSIGNFPTLRCIEQIRNDITYHDLDVKIVAVGGGYSYAALGPSHHTTEELGMMRTIPGLIVCAPGDPDETRMLIRHLVTHRGPAYIRLGKAGEPKVHERLGSEVRIERIGQILPVIQASDSSSIAVFSTGSMLDYCASYLPAHGIMASLYSFPFVKPINREQLLDLFQTYDLIITIEEHQRSAGFGSAVIEMLHDFMTERALSKVPTIRRIAIDDLFISCAGTQSYLREQAGLCLKPEYFQSNEIHRNQHP
jgi:Transketolase, C-terminal subunit